MKFLDLFSAGNNLLPVEQQDFRGNLFQTKFNLIAENRMSLTKLRKIFSKNKTKFLLGVCPSWNLYDFYLLDCINDSLKKKSINEVFEVFDLDRAGNLEDLQKIFGNIKPRDTPILGIWKNGLLSKSLWGWDAKNLLIEKFNFIWKPPKIWSNQQ